MKVDYLKFRIPKDSPTRKPSPIWVGRTWLGSGGRRTLSGFYIRLGKWCRGVAVY